MSDIASGDDKKKEKEFPKLKRGEEVNYNELVTVKNWNAKTKEFTSIKKEVKAYRFTNANGVRCFYLPPAMTPAGLGEDSEIVDADGNSYKVKEKAAIPPHEVVRLK